MTGKEFMKWLEDHDCFNDGPITGFNITGYSLVFRKKHSTLFIYFSGPFDDDHHVPRRDIQDACDGLTIQRPPGFEGKNK